MNEETTKKLKEHELKRMVAEMLFWRAEKAMGEELARLCEIPYEQLPIGEKEKQELYELAKERLPESEKYIPAFKDYCERIQKKEWPRNLCEEIYHEPLLLKEGAEEQMKNNLSEFLAIERDSILKLFCEELGIYPTELRERIIFGLRRLRNPRYNRSIRQYLVFLKEDTPFSEVASACKNEEELRYAFEHVSTSPSQREIPDSLKSEAIALVRAHPEEKITTLFLQKNLKIPYPEAAALKNMFDFRFE